MHVAALLSPAQGDQSIIADRHSLRDRLDRNSRRIDMLDLLLADELLDDARMLCAALLDDLLDLAGRLAQEGHPLAGVHERITQFDRSLAVACADKSLCKSAYATETRKLRALVRELYAAYAVSCGQALLTPTDTLRRRFDWWCVLGVLLMLLAAGGGWFGYKAFIREQAFQRANFLTAADLLAGTNMQGLQIGGLDQTEESRRQRFVWGLGPQTVLAFSLQQPRRLRLEYGIANSLPGQRVSIAVNGVDMAELVFLESPGGDERQSGVDVYNASAGLNAISFLYDDWNGHKSVVNAEDGRQLAVRFTTLRLVADGLGPT